MKKSQFSVEQLATISQIQERDSITRKSAIRKFEKELKAAKLQAAKSVLKTKPEVSKARVAGRERYVLAGKPTQAECIAVYGPRAPVLTWAQRAAMGVDAAHFQKALKAGKYVGPDTKAEAAQGCVGLDSVLVKWWPLLPR